MVATHVKGSDSLLAAMEENLGKNIGQDIQQSSRGVMDDLEKRCVGVIMILYSTPKILY